MENQNSSASSWLSFRDGKREEYPDEYEQWGTRRDPRIGTGLTMQPIVEAADVQLKKSNNKDVKTFAQKRSIHESPT